MNRNLKKFLISQLLLNKTITKSDAQNELRWMIESLEYSYSHKSWLKLNHWCNDRGLRNKPLQYILRSQPFCELNIICRTPILIPRQETEEWTLKLIKTIIHNRNIHPISPVNTTHANQSVIEDHHQLRILDLCSGTGAIALSIAHHLTLNQIPFMIKGVDLNPYAVKLSKLNQRKLLPVLASSSTQSSSLNFEVGNMLEPGFHHTIESFKPNLIVCNPPYIPVTNYSQLDKDVKDWEDERALVAQDGGMLFHKIMIDFLRLGLIDVNEGIPRIVMEIDGEHQVGPLEQKLRDNNVREFEFLKDYRRNTRTLWIH